MIISEKNKYIFVAVPKTGTTSIQKFLLKNDKSASKNSITIKGVRYKFQEHYTANQIKDVLGDELYNKFNVFGFIRDPYSRLVSSYHFYKQGVFWSPNTKKITKRFANGFKKLSAKVLPFKLWIWLYPYKSNIEHFVDSENNIIVNYIGTFENLRDDLGLIFNQLNLNFDLEGLPVSNRSSHQTPESYFQYKGIKNILEKKFYDDLKFYEKYSNSVTKKR